MSNSFNISVKPEIAAVKSVVDANSVILVDVHNTDLPAVKTAVGNNLTAIGANNTILADLHDTDLPDAVTLISAIQTDQFLSVSESDTVIISADTERSVVGVTYTKVKEIIIALPGKYRITFDLKSSNAGNTAYATIYKNGVAFGTQQTNNTTSYVNKSEDLVFSPNDLIQLYLKHAFAGQTSFAQNLKIRGTIGTPGSVVITD